jgi:hypothetical protein
LENFIDAKDVEAIRTGLLNEKGSMDRNVAHSNEAEIRDILNEFGKGNYNQNLNTNFINAMKVQSSMTGDGPKSQYSIDQTKRTFIAGAAGSINAQIMQSMEKMPSYDYLQADKMREAYITKTLTEMGIPKEKIDQYASDIRDKSKADADLMWRNVLKERKDDPVQYVISHRIGDFSTMAPASSSFGMSPDPQVNNQYFNQVVAAQRTIGIPPGAIRLFPSDVAKNIVSSIMNEPNSKTAGQQMLLAQKAWGKNATTAMAELTNMPNGLDQRYASTLYVGNINSAETAVDMIQKPKEFPMQHLRAWIRKMILRISTREHTRRLVMLLGQLLILVTI